MKTKKSIFLRGLLFISTAYFFLVGMNEVWALIGQGDIRVTVGTEIGAAGSRKGNAIVKIRCAGGSGSYSVTDQTASDSNTTAGIIDIASTAVGFTAAGQANCDTQNEWLAASVSLDGFVTASISRSLSNKYTKTIAADTPNSGVASLSFTIHVDGVKDELGNTITLDGTSASISYSGGTATVSYSGGKAYISLSPNDASPVASAGANGYVNKQIALSGIVSTASQSVVFQTGGSANFIGSGLTFAYKFNAYTCCGTSPLSATLTAGNAFGTTCTQSGVGVYYCAVPPSHTGTKVRATKTGYDTTELTYALRASNHSAQITGNIYPTLNSGGGGGGGGGGTVAVSPTPTPVVAVAPTPTPSVSVAPVSPTATPVATSSPVSGVSVVKLFRKVNDPKVYVQKSDGTVTWVKTLDEFNSAGYKWSDVKQISGKDFSKLVITGKLKVKKGIRLNVRDGASFRGKVIIRISSGESYDKKGASGVWFKIMLPDGRDGWIHSSYVSEE